MPGIKQPAAALKDRPGLPAALAFAGAMLLAAALYAHYSPFLAVDDNWLLAEAESFYHGLPLRAGLDSMPLTGYFHSLLSHHLPPWWVKIFLPFAIVSILAVSFAAGAALSGTRGGAVSAAAAGLAFLSIGALVNWGRYFETAVFTLIAGLMALFLLYYRDSGRMRDAVLLGLLTGCSLLCRSTFFLFPPFMLTALWLWRGRLKITIGAAAAITLLPYAMLAPWWLMRGLTGQEFALFETFRAKANIITGLLGCVHTIEGSYHEALTQAGLNGSENLWAWGLRRLASDPPGMAWAVLLRLWAILACKPLLSLLALAALFTSRLDDKAKLAAAFIFYFIAVHLPMPVEARYFVPLLLPLAALIARAAALRLWPDCVARGDTPVGKAAAWLLAALILTGPPAVYAHLGRYIRDIRAADAAAVLRREAAAHPEDPWLLEQGNEARLLGHSPLGAPPPDIRMTARLKFQYLLSGAIYGDQPPGTGEALPGLDKEAEALAFLFGLDNGRPSRQTPAGGTAAGLLKYYSPQRALKLAEKLCAPEAASCAGLLPLALDWQNGERYAESLRLLELLLKWEPGNAELWSDKGMQEFRLGRRVPALASFRRAIRLDPAFIPAYLNLGSVLESAPGGKREAGETYRLALANLTPPYENLRPLLSEGSGPDN